MRESRESRDRERDREGRERDREREREFSAKEKRNSKPDVPVVPMVDHRPGEDKQRPRSSQELKHSRSAALSGVVLPLLSEVNIFSREGGRRPWNGREIREKFINRVPFPLLKDGWTQRWGRGEIN